MFSSFSLCGTPCGGAALRSQESPDGQPDVFIDRRIMDEIVSRIFGF
jgi:hypothetical protein